MWAVQIWEDILGFENAEFYLRRWPELYGKTFAEVLISFPDAIPCGVKVAKGGMLLNPKDDYVLQEGDELLVVAEDEDSYTPSSPAEVCVCLHFHSNVKRNFNTNFKACNV